MLYISAFNRHFHLSSTYCSIKESNQKTASAADYGASQLIQIFLQNERDFSSPILKNTRSRTELSGL